MKSGRIYWNIGITDVPIDPGGLENGLVAVGFADAAVEVTPDRFKFVASVWK